MNAQHVFYFRAILSACSFLLLLAACEPNKFEINAKKSTLIFCSEGSPTSFDPHTVSVGTSFDASARQVYNRLVAFKPGSVNLVPSLAKRWRVKNKGTVYTIYLRKNVAFHSTDYFTPTRKFNADDVIFTFNRQLDPNHPFHSVGNRNYPYVEIQGLHQLIKEINKVDDHTVEFVLNKPFSPFLSLLAMEFTSIMSEEYASHLTASNQKENIIQKPIGTGPFKFIRYQPDAYIRYQAHESYWNDSSNIKYLVFAITPDASLRFARLTAGECDVMNSPLPIHLEAISEQQHLHAVSVAGLNVAYWAFNTRKPPFNNKLVRKAMNHAINRDSIMKAVYYNTAEPARNPIPTGMWSHNDEISNYEYNPQLARNLLYKAGYPNGFSTDIWAFSEQRPYNPNSIKTAELIQQDLKKIGVDAKIVSYEIGTLLRKVRNGEHQTSIQGWLADNGDPDNFFTLLSCDATIPGINSSFWCNEEFDAIIQDAKTITSKRLRTQLYLKAQEIVKDEAPWMTIAHTRQTLIKNSRVENLFASPAGGVFFEGVQLKSQSEKDDK